MGRMAKKLILVSGVLLATLAIAASGHDLLPPDWRGEEGTTYQKWTFDDSDNPAAPEVIQNEYGQASAQITVGAYGSGWLNQLPGFGTQTGYWDLGGSGGRITVNIDNRPVQVPQKDVWVQVTYFQDIHQPPTVQVAGGTYVSEHTVTVESVPTGGAWYLTQSLWWIQPSPSEESIIVNSNFSWGSLVDQVVVDTRATRGCLVELDDLAAFCSQWLLQSAGLQADLDKSGAVDFGDFSLLAAVWLDECPAGWPWP